MPPSVLKCVELRNTNPLPITGGHLNQSETMATALNKHFRANLHPVRAEPEPGDCVLAKAAVTTLAVSQFVITTRAPDDCRKCRRPKVFVQDRHAFAICLV